MTNRLFNAAQTVQNQEIKKLINVYTKVQKQSQQLIKKANKKYQPPLSKKQISSEAIIKRISSQKPKLNPPKPQQQKKPSVPLPPPPKQNIKQRISHLKQQINNQQKNLNNTRKSLTVPSKEQLQYNIFRLKMLCKKTMNTQISMERSLMKESFNFMKQDWMRVKSLEARFILKRYKNILRKYFNEFYKQTMIVKLQREKQEYKNNIKKQQENLKISQDYREFMLCKKAIEAWKFNHQKQIQVKIQKIQKRSMIENTRPEYIIQQNCGNDLKDKLFNFIEKIKEDMTVSEDRKKQAEIYYNTIKQQLEESIDSRAQEWKNQQEDIIVQNTNNNHQQQSSQNPNANPNLPPPAPKKLNNDQLMKKRQQLQLKNKHRKQTLQKLKKQKQQLKHQAQQQKRLQQQLFKQSQRKRHKQQHQKFILKRKQQQQKKRKQQQQRKRMDDLYILAQKHNEFRIMRYKGIIPWKKIVEQKYQRVERLGLKLQRVYLSCSWRYFKERYIEFNQEYQQKQLQKLNKAQKYYLNKTRIKIINIIKHYNNTVAKEQSLFLQTFRETNLMRQTLSIWKKQLIHLKQQNYQNQIKHNKLIQRFRYQLLLKTGFQAFYKNKQESQKERRILEHKIKIKQKMEEARGKRQVIDIDKLL